MITYNNFVGEFLLKKDDESRKAYVKQHIIKDYLPYSLKMSICNNIVNTADYKHIVLDEEHKQDYFSPNTAMRYYLFVLALIQNYTDIMCVGSETNTSDPEAVGHDMMEIFDRFEKNGITTIFMECLDKEYRSLETVLKMKVADTIQLESNLPSYLNTKLDSLRLVAERIENASNQ